MPGNSARAASSSSAPPAPRRWISRRDWQDIRRATQRLQVDGVYAVTVHGVKVEFDKHHLKHAKAAAPRAAAVAAGDAEACLPRRRRAGQIERDALRARHREAQQQQRQVQPLQQQQQQQQQQGELPPQPKQQQQEQQQELLLLPQSDHMDYEKASIKRGAVSPAHGSTPIAPRAKRALPLAPPPPSLPPSPPSTPLRTAQRGGALGSSERTAAKVGLEQTNPQTKCTQARAPSSDTSLRCTLCLRDFPWLYNETDARCRTCDAFEKHVRRSEPAPPLLMPGGRVRLHSLTRADLNGRMGTLLEFVPGKERWAVQVDGPGGDSRILLKGENLVCVPSLRRGPPSWRQLACGDSSDSDTSSD